VGDSNERIGYRLHKR